MTGSVDVTVISCKGPFSLTTTRLLDTFNKFKNEKFGNIKLKLHVYLVYSCSSTLYIECNCYIIVLFFELAYKVLNL